jgi:predicted NBD/HSP70 family sugar kinase
MATTGRGRGDVVVALDVSGTAIKAAVVWRDGCVLHHEDIPTAPAG